MLAVRFLWVVLAFTGIRVRSEQALYDIAVWSVGIIICTRLLNCPCTDWKGTMRWELHYLVDISELLFEWTVTLLRSVYAIIWINVLSRKHNCCKKFTNCTTVYCSYCMRCKNCYMNPVCELRRRLSVMGIWVALDVAVINLRSEM